MLVAFNTLQRKEAKENILPIYIYKYIKNLKKKRKRKKKKILTKNEV